MAQLSVAHKIIVLHRTRFRDTDLIVECLSSDGSKLSCLARGAQKPQNPFAARLDLGCISEVMLVCGRGLPIVTDAQLSILCSSIRTNIIKQTVVFPILDVLRKTTHEDLSVPRLFEMTSTVLSVIDTSEESRAGLLLAGYLLKLFALLGFRPSFSHCVSCGAFVFDDPSARKTFSYQEGGVLCSDCSTFQLAVTYDAEVLKWADALLTMKFDEIATVDASYGTVFSLLQLCHEWLKYTMGLNLKALNYLLSCGLFE